VRQCTAEQFLKDVATHSMKVERDDGVYRHLKFRGPESNSWNLWFDIITWPQCLVINGDMGSWTFARVNDMFTFFRHGQGDELVCQEEALIFMQAKTVRAVVRLVAEHRSICPKCSVFGMPRLPERRPEKSEAGRGTGARRAEWKKAA
jgi:hypothetical protein